MKPVKCSLNGSEVRVVFRNGSGGAAELTLNCGIDMIIGGDSEWSVVLTNLLHEVAESAAMILELRFERCRCLEGDYYFFWTHSEFARVIEHVGWFMAEYGDTLHKAWREWKKEQ